MSTLLANIYNLRGLREAVFAQTDWAPSQSDEAIFRLNQFINRAVYMLATEAPFLFEDTEYQMTLEPVVEPSGTTDTIVSDSGDDWVLRSSLADGSTTNLQISAQKRSYTGRTLMVTDAVDTNVTHEYEIRDMYTISGGTHNGKVGIVLDRPFAKGQSGSSVTYDWRIVTKEYPLPADIIELRAINLREQGRVYSLDVMGQDVVELNSMQHPSTTTTAGQPRWYYRRAPKSLAAPTFTPATDTIKFSGGGSTTWSTAANAQPTGQFEYCFTYVIGDKINRTLPQTADTFDSGSQTTDWREPWLESPPSPVSSAVSSAPVEEGASTYTGITVTLPDVNLMMGFHDSAQVRYQHTGIRKRIYRRRLTDDSGKVEIDKKFHLIAEVDAGVLLYNDNGTDTPARDVVLRNNSRNECVSFYPTSDDHYDVTLRAVVRPEPLVHDHDMPAIPTDAVDAVISATVMYLYESDGNAAMKANARMDFERSLNSLLKRHGSVRKAQRPRKMRVFGTRKGYGWHPRLNMPSKVTSA